MNEQDTRVERLEEEMSLNIAGRLARKFIYSPITPLIGIILLLFGLIAVFMTPREENPQIDVPAVSVIVQYPGSTPEEVQRIIVEPLSRYLKELTGVKHVYGMANHDMGVVTVRFKIGENKEDSYLKLYDRVMQNMDKLPSNASQPLFKPIDIDEVPIVTFALSSATLNTDALYRVAQRMLTPLSRIDNVSKVGITGGHRRQFNIWFDPAKLAQYDLSLETIKEKILQANRSVPLGQINGNRYALRADLPSFITDVAALEKLIVHVKDKKPIYLKDVARVEDGVNQQDRHETWMRVGEAHEQASGLSKGATLAQVTVHVAKKRGSNAVFVAQDILDEVQVLSQSLPNGVSLLITRNDGHKADEAVNELIFHLVISVIIIVILLMVMLGWRESMIVSLTIPLILGVTLFIGLLSGQSINRITLFALILALGLLVDDSIVVIENIHRHVGLGRRSKCAASIYATNEIGGSTNIATLAVMLAFLPMMFVTGMMGPYMGPIPFNVPVAMIASLVIAYIFAPWLAYRFIPVHQTSEPFDITRTKIYRFYDYFVRPMLYSKKKRYAFMGGVLVLFMLSLALPLYQLVAFKMLPGANKNTFNITVDLPTSSALAETKKTLQCVGDILAKEKEIVDFEFFAGIGGVVDFNGLLRGSSMKSGDNIGEIRVNLKDFSKREESSAQMVSRIRPMVQMCAKATYATIKIVEDPPGPPVQATLVAEVTGGTSEGRGKLAKVIEGLYYQVKGVVDIDVSDDERIMGYMYHVNREKAAHSGITIKQIASTLATGLQGETIATAHVATEEEQVNIFMRYEDSLRTTPELLKSITLYSQTLKHDVALSELIDISIVPQASSIKSKDVKAMVEVTAEVDNRGSVYALMDLFTMMKQEGIMPGYQVSYDGNPRLNLSVFDTQSGETFDVVWGGEWELTFDVFRDLGSAFGVAVLLIYLLLVGYYGTFGVPGIVASAVPLTFIGVLPGHALMNLFTPTYFTATSMIGFIALAGIVIRNSLLLVDFMKELVLRGKSIEDAVIEGGATRFRPIVLTALAIILASLVIVADPVWQGLAVSLIFGVAVSTAMTLIVVPLLFWRRIKKRGVESERLTVETHHC